VIGYYARIIAKEVKLPSQFAALAPKVSEFFERKAFGKMVNLEEMAVIKAMNSEARKCVFNLVPCGNTFEKTFAKFLDNSGDVRAFSKLPEAFGFAIEYTDSAMNLRNYYPDFMAVDHEGTNWLLETKGQQTEDVSHKEYAAEMWCENATTLANARWRYLKVMQKAFENLRPESLQELKVLR
jgi:type III restriction enzyme